MSAFQKQPEATKKQQEGSQKEKAGGDSKGENGVEDAAVVA